MSNNFDIRLESVNKNDFPVFIEKLRKSFSVAIVENFGSDELVPSESDIQSSLDAKGAQVYHVMLESERIGGVVLIINEKTHHNSLELFFISPEYHSRGLGLAVWKKIEETYPDTVVWETITPYFERRNINFYVNKCGFHIVEFFNEYHVDKNIPHEKNSDGGFLPIDLYFRFEKVMK